GGCRESGGAITRWDAGACGQGAPREGAPCRLANVIGECPWHRLHILGRSPHVCRRACGGPGLGGATLLRTRRRYKHLKRYREIVEVFLRHGFGYTAERLDLVHLIPLRRRLKRADALAGPPRGNPGTRLRH